jgi:hypothetical protein
MSWRRWKRDGGGYQVVEFLVESGVHNREAISSKVGSGCSGSR